MSAQTRAQTRALRYPLTVFYDASCPLCASEMHALKARDCTGNLELVDCSSPSFDDAGLLAAGVDRAKLMSRLHAHDACGRWVVGPDCFEAVYRAAGAEAIARIWGSRRLRALLDRLYPWIADHRQALSRLGLHAIVRLVLSRGGTTPRCESCRRP